MGSCNASGRTSHISHRPNPLNYCCKRRRPPPCQDQGPCLLESRSWRTVALGGILGQQQQGPLQQTAQPSLDELKNAIRAGMGVGLGMAGAGVWPEGQNHAVEGF